jgi:hypothetical protein
MDLRTDPTFCEGAEPGPLVVRLETIPGWFTLDDCAHFALVLKLQSAFGLLGDLVEIGTYYGRSAAILARFLQRGERLVLCDWFGAAPRALHEVPPTPALLRENLFALNPTLREEQLELHEGASHTLRLSRPVRFAHIDGGHSRAETLGDLRLIDARLLPRGVIAVDDYHHRDFPEVTPAVDQFCAERPDYSVLADLNRHGAIGRKIYLQKGGE